MILWKYPAYWFSVGIHPLIGTHFTDHYPVWLPLSGCEGERNGKYWWHAGLTNKYENCVKSCFLSSSFNLGSDEEYLKLCMCVYERERKREKEGGRGKEKERKREKEEEGERDRERRKSAYS